MGREADANDAARLKAIQDIAANGPRIADRFGRPILIGCEVELHNELPPVYTIVDATPDLSVNAPPGRWTLTLAAQISIIAQNGLRHSKMTVVAFPAVEQEGASTGDRTAPPAADASTAASDAPAAPPSSIILTDMDRTARETLEAAPLKQGLTLVPQPPADPDVPEVPAIDHGGEL